MKHIKRTQMYKKKVGGKWTLKYKRSINCRHPKGFSQKQHCKYGRTRTRTKTKTKTKRRM